ncbi:helix-turn-helix domain-containing protein [Fructobacillus papyrifericola]|uniref:Helix-turn-helix transcriptional regulator n=1 Tax=Fructobacillus papyrifericola TaxID=2713172 RepID=A0ABS5QXJ4_9LACO|nr:helix-turn-helix transcriptional regulator [Fructobacillus papyrifericola]MBS9336627.1 helix-turn-helix transcriptional regulator [Fructobacillus papyrifericola]
MEFGKRLKALRQEKGLTQEDLAKEFYTSWQNISSWENGKSYPNMTDLIRLSDFFDVSLDVFLKEDGQVQESLEKAPVKKILRSVLLTLTFLDLLFAIALLLKHLNVINLGKIASILITLSLFVVIAAIINLRRFGKAFDIDMTFPWQLHLRK